MADAKAPTIAAGDVVAGRYSILRALGEGGMALVFEGEHIKLKKKVAIKVLRPELATNAELVERFEREARAVSRLESPHVARVFDVDEIDGVPFLAMELLEGRDVAEELADRKRIPIAEAVEWLRQACRGVASAHASGVVHRDLKPSNLFLTNEKGARVVKVLDFGIAAFTSDEDVRITRTEAVMGTPLYMSPEQFRSTKNVDARADVWALGATLYELISGRPPFVGSATTIGVAIVNEPLPPLADHVPVPKELASIVARALEKDREKRFQSVNELEAALAEFAAKAQDDSGAPTMMDAPAPPIPRTADVTAPASRIVIDAVPSAATAETMIDATRSAAPVKRRSTSTGVVIAALGAAAIVVFGAMRMRAQIETAAPASSGAPIASSSPATSAPPAPRTSAMPDATPLSSNAAAPSVVPGPSASAPPPPASLRTAPPHATHAPATQAPATSAPSPTKPPLFFPEGK